MKVTVENKKGLKKNIKILIDKKTITEELESKYEEIKKDVVLKGFRPGKVPTAILKKQFGKAVYGEVIDKVLKETSTKVLKDNKIKPAGQPKIDLKSFGEGKDLEYVITVIELPKIDVKPFENLNFEEYVVKIDKKETDKRIDQIAKTQKNFKDVGNEYKAKKGDLVNFDYEATVEGKDFKGSSGKNTQLVLGKDLFIKGFDEQLVGSKKNDNKEIKVKLPDNFNVKELIKKEALFRCKILNVKEPGETKIDDDFAKNLGAKDLNNLKELITKQINDEFKNSLNIITKKKILAQIEKIKIDEIPGNLIDEEVKLLSQGMAKEAVEKNSKSLKSEAEKRIKTGLLLNAFGEEKKVQVSNDEINNELRKQMGMMPGQEKIVQDYYQKNPAALNNLRGSIYEEKIIEEIKKNGKPINKEITKEEAEKILKEENEKSLKEQAKYSPHSQDEKVQENKKENDKDENKNTLSLAKSKVSKKKSSGLIKKKKSLKKVSKK